MDPNPSPPPPARYTSLERSRSPSGRLDAEKGPLFDRVLALYPGIARGGSRCIPGGRNASRSVVALRRASFPALLGERNLRLEVDEAHLSARQTRMIS